MARFGNTVTKEIQASWWEKDEVVVIKKLSWGEQLRVEQNLFSVSAEMGSAENVNARMNIQASNLMTMRLGILSWNFKDQAGQDVPVDQRRIEDLQLEDGQFILAEIEKLNPKNLVTPEIVEEAKERVESNQNYLDELQEKTDADPVMVGLAKQNVEAAKERLEELEKRLAERSDLFPEAEKSA